MRIFFSRGPETHKTSRPHLVREVSSAHPLRSPSIPSLPRDSEPSPPTSRKHRYTHKARPHRTSTKGDGTPPVVPPPHRPETSPAPPAPARAVAGGPPWHRRPPWFAAPLPASPSSRRTTRPGAQPRHSPCCRRPRLDPSSSAAQPASCCSPESLCCSPVSSLLLRHRLHPPWPRLCSKQMNSSVRRTFPLHRHARAKSCLWISSSSSFVERGLLPCSFWDAPSSSSKVRLHDDLTSTVAPKTFHASSPSPRISPSTTTAVIRQVPLRITKFRLPSS